jgi:rhodanese-related sulfurtransferase
MGRVGAKLTNAEEVSMTHTLMKNRSIGRKRLFTEMAVIFLSAAAFGIAWNHRLLETAWTGRNVATSPAPAPTAGEAPIPLPLGLQQVKELYDRNEATFVDARDRAAFAEGHIMGAVSLPVGEAEGELARFRDKVPLTATIVVYCNGYSCHDSKTLADRLIGAGWRQVYVFEGGYPEWRDAAYPVGRGQ